MLRLKCGREESNVSIGKVLLDANLKKVTIISAWEERNITGRGLKRI